MQKDPSDEMTITALLKRFTDQRLPRALEIKEKVAKGEKLGNLDLEFLETVFNDAQYILHFSDKNSEYQNIVSKAVQLYTEITEMALENEKKFKNN